MASSVHLINCSGVVVNADVENFLGIGLTNVVIDYTYSNSTFTGSDVSVIKTSSFSVDRTYHNKTLYIDASLADITITWDCYTLNDLRVNIIRYDATANKVYIDATSIYGTENFIGNALPYDMGLVQYDAVPLTSLSDTIYINH